MLLACFSLSQFCTEEFQLTADVNRVFLYSTAKHLRDVHHATLSKHVVTPYAPDNSPSWLPPARPRTTVASLLPNEFAWNTRNQQPEAYQVAVW